MDPAVTLNVAGLRLLRDQIYRHLLPMMLPVVATIALLVPGCTNRGSARSRVFVLFGVVCIAARVRRGFEHVEWYHFLLELPLYAVIVHSLLGEQSHRAILAALVVFGLMGAHMYWKWGKGPLTMSGRYDPTVTRRGTVRWPPGRVQEYEAIRDALDRLDPSGRRAVFRFGGHNGGLNYLLERPNPTSITQGFLHSVVDPEMALAGLLRTDPPPLLIYDHTYDGALEPQLRMAWFEWDKPLGQVRHVQYDLPFFDRLRAGCTEVEVVAPTRARLTLYDCAGRSVADTPGIRASPSEP
jgi:hypothetical protein